MQQENERREVRQRREKAQEIRRRLDAVYADMTQFVLRDCDKDPSVLEQVASRRADAIDSFKKISAGNVEDVPTGEVGSAEFDLRIYEAVTDMLEARLETPQPPEQAEQVAEDAVSAKNGGRLQQLRERLDALYERIADCQMQKSHSSLADVAARLNSRLDLLDERIVEIEQLSAKDVTPTLIANVELIWRTLQRAEKLQKREA